jgi:hypothetical protein
MDADDVLLRDGRNVGHLLLDLAQHRMGYVAVAVREADQDRRDREPDQREPPVEHEHHHGHAQEGDHVLEEEDEPVPEEEADCLQVDGGPRHQLPGLVPVVEAEGEALEVCVQLVAHVVLDPERLPAGDDAPAHHRQGLHEADGQDEGDVQLELALVVRLDRVVDDRGSEQDECDRGPLRHRRKDHRDDQRELVGAQEPEEAGEGATIRSRSGVH